MPHSYDVRLQSTAAEPLDGQAGRAAIWARLLLVASCVFTAASLILLATVPWT